MELDFFVVVVVTVLIENDRRRRNVLRRWPVAGRPTTVINRPTFPV